MSTMRSQGLLVAVLAALVLLPNLGGPPLWDDDEPLNAACSLAMHRSGDWVVPTFNGRLRVEKPPLVNWVHLAGFAVAGPTETGARLGAALLTIGTCLLTWRIGCHLFRPDAGLWAGIAMATCLWTGVGGRAATPDAPLVFCTTLALWAFVRGACLPRADGDGCRNGPVRVPLPTALAVGAACGLGMLAKGPLALGLPLSGFLLFAWWQAILDPGRAGGRSRRWLAAVGDAWHGVRPLTIVLTAVAVAAPWYVAVSIRTAGDWPRGFLLVHHLGRFATPMEGHSGSTLLYYPLVVLVGMFPWSMASALIGLHAARSARAGGAPERSASVGARLAAAWIAAWLVPFSLAATKLPGYAWPAYPALAAATGLFVADWIRNPNVATDRWMRLAWAFLAVSGVALCIGIPIAARRFAPGHEWLGLVGLVPLVGAILATTFQLLQSRLAASAALGATACATVAVLMAAGPAALGRVGGMRQLAGAIEVASGSDQVPVVSFFAPPSAVFYAGPLTPSGSLTDLKQLDDVVTFVQRNPDARLLVDSRFEPKVRDVLPAGYQVIDEATMLPSSRRLVLLGPADQPATGRTAATADAVHR